MYIVRIEDVKPDQVLAKAVTNRTGATLCPPGFKMTEAAIARLKTAGIESVILEGGPDEDTHYQERLDELNKRFEGVDDPIMLQIKAALVKRISFMAMEDGEQRE